MRNENADPFLSLLCSAHSAVLLRYRHVLSLSLSWLRRVAYACALTLFFVLLRCVRVFHQRSSRTLLRPRTATSSMVPAAFPPPIIRDSLRWPYAYAYSSSSSPVHGGKDPRVRGFIKHTHFGLPLELDHLKSFSRERKIDPEVARQVHSCSPTLFTRQRSQPHHLAH